MLKKGQQLVVTFTFSSGPGIYQVHGTWLDFYDSKNGGYVSLFIDD